MRPAEVVEDYLLAWVVLSVAVGLAVPEVAVVTRFSTPILAVMIGSISLTLSVERFRAVRPRSLVAILAGHAVMPFLAFGIARLLGLSPELTVGFVILGAVTPELVTPVMTELGGGDTALATTALVVTGVASVAFVPAVAAVLVGEAGVEPRPIVEGLTLAVVAPMLLAVALRAAFPERVARHDDRYPAVSAVMVVVIVGGVAGANADLVRSSTGILPSVVGGAVLLNGVGYALGGLLGVPADRPGRVATVLSVGMRDFAVAAALVVAAGLPTVASLPAVAFGVVEMATSAGLARYFAGAAEGREPPAGEAG